MTPPPRNGAEHSPVAATPGKACVIFLILVAVALPAAAPAQDGADVRLDRMTLRCLDKVSGKVAEFEAKAGEPLRCGALSILVRACYGKAPEETPQTTAWIEIHDLEGLSGPAGDAQSNRDGADAPVSPVFRGWMFAENTALSALEHPSYDVWLTGCARSVANGADSAS